MVPSVPVLFQFTHDLGTLSLNITFDQRFMRYYRILNGFVDLHHFEFHGFTHELVVIGNRLNVDLRSRQEGFHTEYVNDQAAFGFAGNQAGNDFAGFIDFDDFSQARAMRADLRLRFRFPSRSSFSTTITSIMSPTLTPPGISLNSFRR